MWHVPPLVSHLLPPLTGCLTRIAMLPHPLSTAPPHLPTYLPTWSSYTPGAPPVLRNVSFSVAGGTTVALVGATGSCKSTCLRLLVRSVGVWELVGVADVRSWCRRHLQLAGSIEVQARIWKLGSERSCLSSSLPRLTNLHSPTLVAQVLRSHLGQGAGRWNRHPAGHAG